jgi:hypothetical protein
MSEILGSFDDGATTADAISNGNGQVVQGTAIRADAPRPDFVAQQPAAAPAQADVTMATEGAYNPNTGVQGSMQNMATEPVYDSFTTTPGATPVMTGTPRSSIEQAAAEEAAREAVAKAERKRIDPKIIIGILVAIILVAAVVVVIALVMNGGKKDSGKKENNQSQVDPEPEPEPTVEMQRIGTAGHGYVSVPKDWVRMPEAEKDGSFNYVDKEKNDMVALNSASNTWMNAENFAKLRLDTAKSSGASQPQMTNEKHGTYDMYKVFFYNSESKKWVFAYVFEAEDERTHYLVVELVDKTSSLISSVPDSWSLNQNSEGAPAKTEKEKEEKTEEKTDGAADKSSDTDDTDGADDTDDTADDTEE